MKHYVAMAGLHDYLPNTCDVYDSYEDACESMIVLHDLQWARRGEEGKFLPSAKSLRADGYLELELAIDGNEYIEISECDCDAPWEHSDSTSEEEWGAEHSREGGENDA